jgi:hypothetical protein
MGMDFTIFEMGMGLTFLEIGMDYMELEKMVGTIILLHLGLQFMVELEFMVLGTIIFYHQ